MKITKAVIPAAGFGTRVLPATKAIPKEMFPIVDKPAIQYIVEEAVASGITDILIIISKGKSSIEDHFDRHEELERRLSSPEKEQLLKSIVDPANLANITFVRQKEMKGLGHAILCAENFVGGEPFAILYGDDVVICDIPATKELIEGYEKYGKSVAGIKEVPKSDISKYSSLDVSPLSSNMYEISDMIEKPAPGEEKSLFSILGRVVLSPEIFEILKTTPPGAGGEIQLTDAMKVLANRDGMIGVNYHSTRYDMGNKLGIMQASVETALTHPEIGNSFREYLKELAKTL